MGKIMVNGENYSGTEVVANPTLEGGEATLNSLEIDAVKYALGGGGGGSLEIKKIFDNVSGTSYTTYQLTESVYNFDFIIIIGQVLLGSNLVNSYGIFTSEFLKQKIKNGINYYMQVACQEQVTNYQMNNPQNEGGDGDKIDYASDSGVRTTIMQIYGIKI